MSRAEAVQDIEQLLSLGGGSCLAQGQRDNLCSMDMLGQEGKWGCLPGEHPDAEFIRHRLGEAGELRQHGLRLGQRDEFGIRSL